MTLPRAMIDDPGFAQPGASFGSIFTVPSINEILRGNGRVASADADAIRIDVEECYFYCGKALIRSEF